MDDKTGCVQCAAGCKKCNETICEICEEGYGLDTANNTCVTPIPVATNIPNCKYHKITTDGSKKCQECQEDYDLYYNNSQCIKKLIHCYIRNGSLVNLCDFCKNGYMLKSSCEIDTTVCGYQNECKHCNQTREECLVCGIGYYKDDTTNNCVILDETTSDYKIDGC